MSGRPGTGSLGPGWAGVATLGLAWLAAGCTAAPPPLPLRPKPVAYADTLPIREPAERTVNEAGERWKHAFTEPVAAGLDVRRWAGKGREALNLTHFDDVVNSAWFEHRNGRQSMTPRQVAAGAAADAGPDTSRTLTIVDGKAEGAMPGFTVEDARGGRYLFKFDPPGYPHMASSANVIVSRLFHAAGYHVPADYKIVFDAGRLAVDPGAEFATPEGRSRPMTEADVETILERVAVLPDGRHTAVASRFIPGIPKGPFGFAGRRADDPNDHYRHEHRRELRGAFVLAAWLNHADLVFQNTMSVWIDPPGYLRHYLFDFGIGLGSSQVEPHNPREEREHNIDLWPTLARFFTLGLYRVGWEGWEWSVIHPSLGWLPAEGYDPARWKPNWPSQAWRLVTPADGYWGAKLVSSFTDEQVAAAVAAGELPPAAADTLVQILLHRRDRTVEHWFGTVTPIEEPTAAPVAPPERGGPAGFALSFRDLGLERGLWEPRSTRYEWEFRDPARGIRWRGFGPGIPSERQRLRILPPPGERTPREGAADGLAVLELRAVREAAEGRTDGRPATLWLRWDGEGYAVVGLLH